MQQKDDLVMHRCGGDQGLHEVNPAVAALEERNALALAIIPPGKSSRGFSSQ
jgi:hypothetical protein